MVFRIDLQNEEYIQIVLTHECNRKCRFCIDHRRGDDAYLTKESLERAISFAKKGKTKDILFIGGEPTLHPNFREYCILVKDAGLNLIVTTNFDNPEIIHENADVVDSWNFSYYGQKNIPFIPNVDITISGLIYSKGFLSTKEKLDAFIDKYQDKYSLKFSTLTVINEYTAKFGDPGEWIDNLDAEKIILFDFIPAQIYRGHLIKRYDIEGPDLPTLDSFKCLVDGEITRNWVSDPNDSTLKGLGSKTFDEIKSGL